jgi:hypothetical protein
MERKSLQGMPDISVTTARNLVMMMMIRSAFAVRTGVWSPPKAGSSASDVTDGLSLRAGIDSYVDVAVHFCPVRVS